MKNYWKLKLSSLAATLFFSLISVIAYAQLSQPAFLKEPERFIYPVHPGQPGSLAGTMGELRATHFHSGIDIRTNNMIGYPVVASKSGYISRVTVTPSGYGNIIYIRHADGHTTLYAHLDKFVGPVAEHVLREQYAQKSFSVDLTFAEGRFPVKQGELIALSGNTGSSGGPHLHFDIRDKDNYALDPLKVAAFPEITDRLAPAPEKIALKTLDINSRINDKFGRFEFYAATRTGNRYSMATPIIASGVIGLEIVAKDRLAQGSPFFGGVNHIDVRVDNELVFSQNIEKIDIAETRAIYTLMDFKTMRNKGTRFYKLYIDDGNALKFYEKSPGSGKISVKPNKTSIIEITMKDSYGNSSVVSFDIRFSPLIKDVPTLEAFNNDLVADVVENTLMVTTRPCTDTTSRALMYVNGSSSELAPAYFNNNRSIFLVDLRRVQPDSIVTCGRKYVTNLRQVVKPGVEYTYSNDYVDVTFPNDCLYDTLYLTQYYERSDKSETIGIGDRTIPLNRSIEVSFKPRNVYPAGERYGVYRVVGRSGSYIGGEFVNGRINFTTRELGEFTILQDNQGPTIRAVLADRNNARFKIKDNLSGIDKIEATINGEWVLMHYDAKSGTIFSEKLDKTKPFKGTFVLKVSDNAGNTSTFTRKIQ
jgi:murein DD-endopeptidase MepM/ murein hydrolase activator NlpD